MEDNSGSLTNRTGSPTGSRPAAAPSVCCDDDDDAGAYLALEPKMSVNPDVLGDARLYDVVEAPLRLLSGQKKKRHEKRRYITENTRKEDGEEPHIMCA